MQVMDVGDESLFKQGGKQGYLTEETSVPAVLASAHYEADKNYVTDFDEDEESEETFLFASRRWKWEKSRL